MMKMSVHRKVYKSESHPLKNRITSPYIRMSIINHSGLASAPKSYECTHNICVPKHIWDLKLWNYHSDSCLQFAVITIISSETMCFNEASSWHHQAGHEVKISPNLSKFRWWECKPTLDRCSADTPRTISTPTARYHSVSDIFIFSACSGVSLILSSLSTYAHRSL